MDNEQKIIELYNNNNSIIKISKALNISQYLISKTLKNSNISIRKTNYQSKELNVEEINRLYNEGTSTYKLAEAYGCSDETIRKLIKTIRSESDRNIRSEESKDKIRKASKELWESDEYRNKVRQKTSTEAYKEKLRAAAKKYNKLQNWRLSLTKEEYSKIISNNVKKYWLNIDYKNKMVNALPSKIAKSLIAFKKFLDDPVKKQQWADKLRKTSTNNRIKQTGTISFTQQLLYYILDFSGIKYYKEGPNTKIEPYYIVDCIIPKQQNMVKDLIIEVQGEYWHNLPQTILKDKQKETYIRNNTDYDLLKIEELHLSSFSHISSKLFQYGITLESKNCNVNDLVIKKITESIARKFYSVFHYTSTIRKGAITYGAYFDDELVAAISYTYPIRTQIANKLELSYSQVLEISRLARNDLYNCENLCSFLIGKTRKLLPKTVKVIVSYSDSTYGHTGGVYKASGFVFDGVIKNNYHYKSSDGIFHKKTIWDMAKKMKMSENEYVIKHGLIRVDTDDKSRWIYKRCSS